MGDKSIKEICRVNSVSVFIQSFYVSCLSLFVFKPNKRRQKSTIEIIFIKKNRPYDNRTTLSSIETNLKA